MDVAKFDDAYFKPTEKKDKKKGEAEFFQVCTASVYGLCLWLLPSVLVMVRGGAQGW